MQKVVPAILTADAEDLRRTLGILKGHTKWLHIDIADGKFVPAVTHGILQLGEAYQYFSLELHLLVQEPLQYASECKEVGAKRVIVHKEAVQDIAGTLESFARQGLRAGIGLNPETDLAEVASFPERMDSLLLMGVHPGSQGQEFIPSTEEKIREARKRFPSALLCMDGGLRKENIRSIWDAGASYVIAGSSVVRQEDPVAALRTLEAFIGQEGS